MSDITKEMVREFLHYDPITGFFTWKKRGRHWFKSDSSFKTYNSKFFGKRAGCVVRGGKHPYPRRVIGISGKLYSEHILAWMWMEDSPLPP